MKKFTKIALIIASIMSVIGVLCLIGSFAMGFTWGTFADMVQSGKFSFGFSGKNSGIIHMGKSVCSDEVEEKCRNLDIELKAGTLKIYYDDVNYIQIEQEDVPGFKYYIDEETLYVEGGSKFGIHHSAGTVTLVIPKNMIFDEVDLEIGAGEANVEGLAANTVNVDVGAGEADITGLDVKNLNAETGAGQLYMELIGSEEDYNYDVECGVGEVQIGESTFEGLGREQHLTHPGANRFLDVECGVGEIQIEFQK